MTVYTMAAYPTVYRGRRYRSRLEARWAAFFDQLGWVHEYEPFDLGSWSPDFLITGKDNSILVEVKPITEHDHSVARKMFYATVDRRHTLLLVGVSPLWAPAGSQETPSVGWVVPTPYSGGPSYNDYFGTGETPETAIFKIFTDDGGPVIDFSPADFDLGELTGYSSNYTPAVYGGITRSFDNYRTDLLEHIGLRTSYNEKLVRLWADASNAVQWRPA